MQPQKTLPDTFRLRGSLYGLILGDIIGSYFEFTAPSSRGYPDLNALKHGLNVFKVRFGYTDDTILTLHSMDAFIESHGLYRPLLHVTGWHLYLTGGSQWSPSSSCFDIGRSTRRSLQRLQWNGKDSPENSGNGVLMKLLPFAWYVAGTQESNLLEVFDSVTRITHGSPDTLRTSRIMGKVLVALLYGCTWDEARKVFIDDYPIEHTLQKGRSFSGYCDDSLALAFHLMDCKFDWQTAISKIISLGGDTDTNAAIFGQLYGAAYPNEMMLHYVPHICDIHRGHEINVLLEMFIDCMSAANDSIGRLRPFHRNSKATSKQIRMDADEARLDGQLYRLDCPRDCVHYGEGCLLSYPVRPLDYFRRMNSPLRDQITWVRSDSFRELWRKQLNRCPPKGAMPCYHTSVECSGCEGSKCSINRKSEK